MANRRFIIQVGETYYMTSGPLMVYDAGNTKGNKHKADGVEEIRKKFESVDASARYSAVEVKDADFAAANVSSE